MIKTRGGEQGDNRDLRILHAIHDFLPRHRAGSEVYAFGLCQELASRHHVSVVCAEFDPARPHATLAWRQTGGLPVVEIVNNWRIRAFEDTYRCPAVTARLADVLSMVHPDVVHVHNLLNLSFELPALARARGIPVVATLHDYTLVCASGGQRLHRADQHVCSTIDPDRCARCFRESPFYAQATLGTLARATRAPAAVRRTARAVHHRLPRAAAAVAGLLQRGPGFRVTPGDVERRLEAAREVFANVDLFVAPSQSMAREFEALGIPASRLRVSGYGLPPPAPATDTSHARRLRLGYVGTIVWHKGIHVLLDALRAVPQDAVELLIFGDPGVFPGYTASLVEQARGLPVTWMGPFDVADAAAAYAQIDALVVPSIWLENSPLVIHEALMAGRPVIGARIGGIPELVQHERNGLVYHATSSSDLAVAIQRLLSEPGLLAGLAEGARGTPVKSTAADAREWETVYAGLIDSRRREARR